MTDPSLWEELVHPDDLEGLEAWYESFWETGQPETSEYRMVRRDGRVVWVRDHATMLKDAEGKPRVIQGVIHDITEAKAAEEASEFQARLMENITDAVIAYDAEMVVTSWNGAAQVLYGWLAEEVLGRPLPDGLRYEPDMIDTTSVWDPVLQDSRAWIGRVVQRDRDGYEIHVETKGVPLREPDGSIRGHMLVNREVAEI